MNPSCKSHGRPHPNCRCYNELAKGGDASFCSTDQKHSSECQYFADGGEAIDPSQVVIDEPVVEEEIPADQVVIDEEIPADQVVIDKPVAEEEEEIPADQVVIDEPLDADEEIPADQVVIDEPGLGSQLVDAAKERLTPDTLDGHKITRLIKDYEDAFGIGSLITGSGAVGLANKAAAASAEYLRLGKLGAGVLKGAMSNGLIQGADEASKMFLGQDQEHPVAAILASAGLGSVLGFAGAKVGSMAADKLSAIKDTKLGNAAASFLAGLGGPQKAAATIGAYEGVRRGYEEDGIEGALEEGAKGGAKGFALGKALGIAGKALTPVLIKMLSSQTVRGIGDGLNQFEKYSNGIKHVDQVVDGLFDKSAKAASGAISHRKELEEWMDGGGIDQDLQQEIHDQHASPETQGFAEGGDVKPVSKREDGVATHFPEQNVIMQTAKARASNYLNSLRPAKNQSKLAFDDEPDDRQQKKTYKRALDVAASPLGVLDRIKNGTIEPEHIKHLNGMFPEVTALLQQKATDRILKAQLSGKKPNYKVRQGLSMLLGTPLSGELTPQNIQAAQAVFAKAGGQQPPNQSQPKSSSSSKLSKSDRAYLTDDQARQQRQQRQT